MSATEPKPPAPDFPLTTDKRMAAFTAARLDGKSPREAQVAAIEAAVGEACAGILVKGVKFKVDTRGEFGWDSYNGRRRWSIRISDINRKFVRDKKRGGETVYTVAPGGSFTQSQKTGEFNWARLREKVKQHSQWLAREREEEAEIETRAGTNHPVRIAKTLRAEFNPERVDPVPLGDDTAAIVVPVTTVAQGRVVMNALKHLGLL